MSAIIRLYIVDDQPTIRDDLAYMLGHQPDMVVVGTAGTAQESLKGCQVTHPDVVLMDIRLPGESGLVATRMMTSWSPPPKIILLTTFDLDEYVLEGLRAGAMGYILKDLPTAQLLDTIRAVWRGEAIFRTQSASWAMGQALRPFPSRSEGQSDPDGESLTDREREVLQRMASGERNIDIAHALFLSEGTVKSHVHSILQKLNVADRTQAVVWAFRNGLVE